MQTRANELANLTQAISLVKNKEVGVANSYRLAKLAKEVIDLLAPISEVQNNIREKYQKDVAEAKTDDEKTKILNDANAQLKESDSQLIEHDLSITLEPHDAFTPEFMGTFITILGKSFIMNGI